MQEQESPKQALDRRIAEREAEEAEAVALRERHRREASGDRDALRSRLASVDEELAPLRKRLLALQAEVHRYLRERQAIVDVLAEAELAARADGSVDWTWLLDASLDGRVSHHAWTRALEEFGLHPSGHSPQTKQRGIQVMMTRGDGGGFRRALAGLREILPHVRPQPDGWIHVGILESSLNQFRSWEMRLRPGLSEIEVGTTQSGRCKIFEDLEAALQYVQDHLWYRKKG